MTARRTMVDLQALSESGDYYNTALNLYDRESRRIQRLSGWVEKNLPALAESIRPGLQDGEELMVLSVGPGKGDSDHRILRHLRDSAHPNIRSVILEPDYHMLEQYQDYVTKESTKLQGVDFDWRQQTFQEYQAIAKEDDKFHFISCFSSIYYCGDLAKSLKYLYEKLHPRGILVVALMTGEGGFGRLWHRLHQTLGMTIDFITSTDVEHACRTQSIPIAETQTIDIYCDISSCFDSPRQLSQDGNTLLDFLTHTVNFAKNAPAEYRDEVLRFLRSEACSKTGPTGEVIFNGCDTAVIIRRQLSRTEWSLHKAWSSVSDLSMLWSSGPQSLNLPIPRISGNTTKHGFHGILFLRLLSLDIGGWGNTKSAIRPCKSDTGGVCNVVQTGYNENHIVSDVEYRSFWVDYQEGVVKVGKGGQEEAIIEYRLAFALA